MNSDKVSNSEAGKSTSSMTHLVLSLAKPYKHWIALVFFTMLVDTAMTLAAPWPLKIVLDNALGNKPLPAWLQWVHTLGLDSGTMSLALFAGVLTLLIAAIDAVANYINNYYTESISQYVANDLRERMYDKLNVLSMHYYSKHDIGALLSTMSSDISTVQSFVSSSTLGILVDILTIIGMIGLMFYLEWDFTLIALAVTPFMLLFVGRLKRAVKTATVEVRKKQAQVIAVATQGLGAERSIQAFDRQDLESRRMMAISYETVMAALKARAYKALMSPIVSIIVAGCTGVVLWLGTKQVLAGAMTVGGLTVFLAYLKQFFSPVKDLATMSNTIAQTTVSLERIYDILDSDDMIPEKPDAKLPPKAMKGEIVFEDVAFAYEPDNPILRGVSFTVKPGQMVGVVGSTGSGKSTIASLIPRFYDPTQGTVKIDGTDVRDFQLHPLRQQIGFVLQETVLFKGTIRENIAYGRRDEVSDEEIIEAAKLANAHEFIVQMPAGYNTPVGDRGDTMSGGQRQRIGIARAMIRNNPIMILDEPTAALDTQSEKAVMEGLRSLIKGRTAITIAHRLSTIREADNIIALDKGVIIEQGTHQELMTLNGFYANLYRIQFPDEGASPTASAAPATTSA